MSYFVEGERALPSRYNCPACGAAVSAEARYCDHCGTPLSPGAVLSRRPSRAPGRIAVWAFVLILFTLFGAGSLGGFLYKANRWPWQPTLAAGTDLAQDFKPPLPTNQDTRQQEGYFRSLVAITVRGPNGNRDGSGFILSSKGHVITAAHVVEGAKCVTVTDHNLKQHQGRVLRTDPNWDVAVIGVPTLINPPASLEVGESRSLGFDEELYILGTPRGAGAATHSTVRYSNIARDQKIDSVFFKELIVTTGAVVLEGTSGGPLVQKSSGKVVGVVTAGSGTTVGYAVPVDAVAALFANWRALPLEGTCSNDPTARTTPLSLAVIVPQSGRHGVWGNDLADGALLALRDMETDLRRAGYDVTLQKHDDQGSVALAGEIARRVEYDPAVIGVVGSLESNVTAEIAAALKGSSLPMVAPMATADSLTARGWTHFNRLVANARRQGAAAARFAAERMGRRAVYVLEDGTPDGTAQATAFTTAAQVLSLKVVDRAQISGSVDYESLKEKIAAAQADAIYYAGGSDVALQVIQGLRNAGVSLPILGADTLNDTRFRALPTSVSQKVYFTSLTVGDNDRFRRIFEDTLGKPSGGYASYGYDAARVILEALVRYGITNPGKVPARSELAALVRQTRGQSGRTAPITFDENGENRTSLVYMFEWTAGRPELRQEMQ